MQYLFRSANDDNDDNNQGDDDGEDDKNDTNKNNELSQRLMMNDKVAFVSITLTTTMVKTKIVTMTTIIKNGNNNQCPVNCDHNNVTTVILHFCDSSKKHRFIDLINSIWRSTMIQ